MIRPTNFTVLKNLFSFLFLLVIITVGCSPSESDKLHTLIYDSREFGRSQNSADSDENSNPFGDASLQEEEERYLFWVDIQERLDDEIDRESLDNNDQITYDSFARQVKNRVGSYEYLTHLIPINHEGGFYNRVLGSGIRGGFNEIEDYESYLNRLRAIPDYFDQNIERMRVGIEQGVTLPKVIFVEDYNYYILTHIDGEPKQSQFYEPFLEMSDQILEAEQERLR